MKLISYGHKFGDAPAAHMRMSVTSLPNPFNQWPDRTGLDPEVKAFVTENRRGMDTIRSLVVDAVTLDKLRHGDVIIAVGCYGGKHRSVAVVEEAADQLRTLGYTVDVEHRDINRP